MKNLYYFFTIAFFLLVSTACNKDDVVKDMVEFDRAFIPAYYYSSLGNLESAEKSMFLLDAKYQKFNAKYGNKKPQSDDWNESIRLVGAWLEETKCALKDGNAQRAQIQLDHARYELMDLRWRENVNDYYLDYVWDLEASIDVVVQTSSDPMIELLSWNEFEPMCNEVLISWMNLKQRPIDHALFECSEGMDREVNFQKEKLNYAINNFEYAMGSADRCDITEAALALEPAYLNFMAMFGDFESVQSYYALKE